MLPKYLANLDQDWADSETWFDRLPKGIGIRLADTLSADDPAELIQWMRDNPKLADCVQRLALLALHQTTYNWMSHREKEG